MSIFFCPTCNSSNKLGVISHEVITVQPDSNTDKHDMELPTVISAKVKCFDCDCVFSAIITLEYEVNPF
jgi:hypothetical protein